MAPTSDTMPTARTDDVVVEDLLDESVIYDLKTNQAHSLNQTATLVWRHCDGHTTVAQMATLLAKELDVPAHEALVWMTLKRLSRVHLLTAPVTVPAASAPYSRRDAMRALGLAAVLPVIASIVVPSAAHAQSCVSSCSGQPNCTPCNPTQCNRKCCAGACLPGGQANSNCGC